MSNVCFHYINLYLGLVVGHRLILCLRVSRIDIKVKSAIAIPRSNALVFVYICKYVR